MASYDYINATGVIVPDTSTAKAEVEAEYKDVYGADFVVDPSTEQGREVDAEVTSRISVLRNNAKLANQINPDMAEDVFFDAVYALSGGQRDQEERSTVTCTVAGVYNTIILKGSQVEDDNRVRWEAAISIVIPVSGTVDASFFSVDYGPIQALPGTITTIIDGTLGWETVNNSSAAVPGKLEQSVVSGRRQRKVELGLNGRSNSLAIMSAISVLENVASLTFRENYTGSTIVVDGVTLVEHSTYACVDGGAESEIAEAYYEARSGGSNFNGGVSELITDPNSGQEITVKFDRPDDKPKLVRVTAKAQTGQFPTDDIKKAVVDYANGLVNGEDGFVVGADASPFEIAAAINYQYANVFIRKVEIAEKVMSPVFSTDTLETEIFEKASVVEADISVVLV